MHSRPVSASTPSGTGHFSGAAARILTTSRGSQSCSWSPPGFDLGREIGPQPGVSLAGPPLPLVHSPAVPHLRRRVVFRTSSLPQVERLQIRRRVVLPELPAGPVPHPSERVWAAITTGSRTSPSRAPFRSPPETGTRERVAACPEESWAASPPGDCSVRTPDTLPKLNLDPSRPPRQEPTCRRKSVSRRQPPFRPGRAPTRHGSRTGQHCPASRSPLRPGARPRVQRWP